MKRKKAVPPVRHPNCEVIGPRDDFSAAYNNFASRARVDLSSLKGQSSTQDVFIYTINEQDLVIPPHPFLPKGMVVRAKSPDSLCSLVLTLPSKCYSVKENMEEDTLVPFAVDGVRVAVDIINPDNLGGDLDAEIGRPFSFGRDLSQRGLFYSLSNPPSMLDYEAAKKRLGKYYRGLVERATAIYWSGGYRHKDEVDYELPLAVKFLGLVDVPWARRKDDRKK